ncbi:type VII secretion protein EccB [Saccharopolyspora antimicrobica]|uniref:Type VII secretion protein EccB n=2 Tax=Saccharopolyspora antimicrobica TaxID=455193 RepID=A0ABX9TCM2_9PSEU|nr:type VII secretion protein EccB [Saccharopolyspora antimicrobica]RKT84767.1 type VII secretion protein EccB [Saccharopolyspora antimicrobica]
MQSRRDQVQAHMFVMGRLSAGMLRADPDIPDTPQRRTSRGIVIGVVVSVLLGLGTFLFGLIKPGGATSWQVAGAVVVEKETGARWQYVNGVLHPVLNQASARLLAGAEMQVHTVSANSLAGTPRGLPIGIPGAPDGLPTLGALSSDPWLSCASPAQGGRDFAMLVGEFDGEPLTATDGALVAGPDGTVFLVWSGHKLRMDVASAGPAALGYGTTDPIAVPAGFLNALPTGPDLVAPEIDGRGEAGPQLAGAPSVIGQLFQDASGEPYLLTKAGLVPLTDTLFKLISGDPRTQAAAYGGQPVEPRRIGANDLTANGAPSAAKSELTRNGAFPDAPPVLVQDDEQALCVATEPGPPVSTSVSLLPKELTDTANPVVPLPGITVSCPRPDRVGVVPGSGVLVSVLSTGDVPTPTLFLVADNGVKYPVPSSDVAGRLGYATAAVAMPAMLVDQLPTGPALDPAKAGLPVTELPPVTPAQC